ncbi:hypothetical protein RRV45_08720 [Bacillus sp. DTU_2020_1000418_1_SI_GHA_SEK_038]|uniref:hypothetical protein n=1 Tax=Bacillus sp. DTU_2020_1000418_1_SI_GHA_SEK_038 TaxID=3077585 RepID=UPI0028EBC946|nr:hypothetical protein [Bacillus sp. DTU_2020_1000418_1_SI_GHA_SEK_038]WNS77051.1 hypothetical protein RRV45_08720 [Bacillus sp. DTU_2020_1000418_1_SI_GHA_SEK_038]
MVTAIVIPIICIYFYWVTKKEMRESHEKWLKLKNTPEEAIISGTIVNLNESRQRFSYHRFVYVIDIKIKSEYSYWDVKRLIPMDKEAEIPHLKKGGKIRVYGNWKEDYFLVNRIEQLG